MGDRPRTRDALRHPDFRRFWLGNGASALGSHLTGLALPLLVLDQTGSAVLAGLVGTARMLAYLAVHLPAGALADRLQRRRILLVADAVRALLVLIVGVSVATGGRLGVPALVVLAVLGSILSSAADPASQAAVRHLVGPDEMPSALALNTVRGQVIMLVAPAVGGLLYQLWPALPFLVDAATFIVSFLAIWLVRTPMGGRSGPARSLVTEIGTGLRHIRGSGFLMVFLLWAALGNFATGGIAFAVMLAVQPRGGTALGVAMSVIALGGLVGAGVAARFGRLPTRLVVPCAAGIRVLIGAVMVGAPGAATLTVGMTLIALLGPAMTIPYQAHVYRLVPDHLTGRVQSAMTLLGGALYPFAGVTTGWFAEQLSIRGALAFLAALLVAVLALALLPALRIPDRRDGAPTHAASGGRRSGRVLREQPEQVA